MRLAKVISDHYDHTVNHPVVDCQHSPTSLFSFNSVAPLEKDSCFNLNMTCLEGVFPGKRHVMNKITCRGWISHFTASQEGLYPAILNISACCHSYVKYSTMAQFKLVLWSWWIELMNLPIVSISFKKCCFWNHFVLFHAKMWYYLCNLQQRCCAN